MPMTSLVSKARRWSRLKLAGTPHQARSVVARPGRRRDRSARRTHLRRARRSGQIRADDDERCGFCGASTSHLLPATCPAWPAAVHNGRRCDSSGDRVAFLATPLDVGRGGSRATFLPRSYEHLFSLVAHASSFRHRARPSVGRPLVARRASSGSRPRQGVRPVARDTRDFFLCQRRTAVNTATLEPFARPTIQLALRRTDRRRESLTGGSACCAASLKRAVPLR